MSAGVLELTMKEVDRLKVVEQILTKKLRIREAARQLDLSKRQVLRLCKRIRREGNRGIIHGLRGRASNHRLPAGLLERAIEIVKTQYSDFGPTLALEHLESEHDVHISINTLRKGMIESGLWTAKRRKARHRQFRERRSCTGELVQLDGSLHDWFEGRGDYCVLLTFVDDATSRILYAEFVNSEDTLNLMRATRSYLRKCGRPISFYVDKDSIYRVNRQATIDEQLRDSQPMTQFSRAMDELGIKVTFAHSPQAKGRVERGFKTHQDRLVKKLRLRSISSIDEANRFLPTYLCEHNARFSVKPANPTNSHRRLLKSHRLKEILSVRTERIVNNDFTVRFQNQFFQLLPETKCSLRPKGKIVFEFRLDGSLHIKHKDQEIKFKRIEKPAPIPKLPGLGKGNRKPPKKTERSEWKNFMFSLNGLKYVGMRSGGDGHPPHTPPAAAK